MKNVVTNSIVRWQTVSNPDTLCFIAIYKSLDTPNSCIFNTWQSGFHNNNPGSVNRLWLERRMDGNDVDEEDGNEGDGEDDNDDDDDVKWPEDEQTAANSSNLDG